MPYWDKKAELAFDTDTLHRNKNFGTTSLIKVHNVIGVAYK